MGILSRLMHAWNAFKNTALDVRLYGDGMSYGNRPDRNRLRFTNERSIISSVFTRLAIDVGSVDIRHVRLDEERRYLEDIDSGLNNCLTVEANLDQAAQAFRMDIAMTLFDQGCAAIVPVDTTIDPSVSAGFDIQTLRVGEIVAWMPRHVRVRLYNEAKGYREEITLEKKYVAIVENPLFAVMNEPNSTLQRLIRKLNLLDVVDEQSSSGKLDIIIQLPYVIRSDARRQQAEQRRVDIENQLNGSKYGIAYTDGTEKITQLNRPAENNLLKQVEYLTNLLYAQLGVTPEVMNGTADEKTMINYNNRTIKPIVTAIMESMRRSFLSKTARSQLQWILAFRDPLSLVPLSEMADLADKLIRGEVVTGNELRAAMGIKPHPDPKADQLRNPNMPTPDPAAAPPDPSMLPPDPMAQDQLQQSDPEITRKFNELVSNLQSIGAHRSVTLQRSAPTNERRKENSQNGS